MNATMSFMFWKDRQKVRKSEIKSIQQDWNVILQRPAYVACAETINLPQSIDLKESESVSCHASRVFVTVWFFFLRAGWGTSLKRRRLFAIMPRKASENGFAGFWCVPLLWIRSASDQHIFFESDQHNFFLECIRGGAKLSDKCPVQP